MDLAGIAGPFIGVAVARLFGLAALEHFSSLLTLSSMAIQLTMSETLKPEDRKPFKFSTANPFSNLQLLFTNGAGLRRLTISTSLWFWCQEIWSTQSAFRMGVLRWSPVDQSYFDSLYNAAGAVSRRTFLDPVLKSLGNRSAFELGSLLSVLSYFIQVRKRISYAMPCYSLQKMMIILPRQARDKHSESTQEEMRLLTEPELASARGNARAHGSAVLHWDSDPRDAARHDGQLDARHGGEAGAGGVERWQGATERRLLRARSDYCCRFCAVVGRSLQVLFGPVGKHAAPAALGAWWSLPRHVRDDARRLGRAAYRRPEHAIR
jgi:hypothetical protein